MSKTIVAIAAIAILMVAGGCGGDQGGSVPRAPALFDANGSAGRPSTGTPGCPTIAERLAQMDRLGITRSFVWNTEARQGHSLSCNRRLLDEIAHTPGAEGRIVPALIVSGLIAYERNGVEQLAGQMHEGKTCALRFVNVYGLLKLMQCEPVVRAVRDLKPFILLNPTETDTRDILDFTAALPGVPVVLTDLTCPVDSGVSDLMGERSNVFIAVSWQQEVEDIVAIVQQVGPERVLFGTSDDSDGDGALAALAQAGIPEDQRRMITQGNLDRLNETAVERAADTPPVIQTKQPSPEYGHIGPMPSLFDVNGNVGSAADCPAISDRLAHMDRLGIERSLVWNSRIRGESSLVCNRRLLDDFATSYGTAGRIVPALIVSGGITEEPEGTQTLADQMREAGTGALRFVSFSRGQKLMDCEPIVREVRDLRPFVLVKWNDTDVYDILDFAEKLPDVPVILTEVMWTGGIGAMDLLRQRPNIRIEISSWHTYEGIALLVKHFGADRILFGTGYRSHNGAAIAALARAGISDIQRQLIAHGNLDRLTGLVPRSEWANLSRGNDLWRRYLAGEPLGVDMVDAHGHIGPLSGFVLENQDERDQIPVVLAEMDRLGERKMIISGLAALMGPPARGNDSLHELLKPHADKLAIYVVFNPFYTSELLPKLDEWFADPQFAGFKTLCSYWKVKINDPRFDPMWEYANRHRLPVLMHSWSDPWCSPGMTREIVQKYKDMTLLVGHAGGTGRGRREAEELAAEFPNVYLEWCGSFCTTRRWEDTLEMVPASKVVYGTDAAGHDINWELGRLLSLDIPEDDIIAILGNNMRGILDRRR